MTQLPTVGPSVFLLADRYSPGRAAECALFALFAATSTLIFSAGSQAERPVAQPVLDAHQLVQVVVQNELNAQDNDKSLWTYQEVRTERARTESRRVVETNDGEVHRLLAVNGKPLTDKERQKEEQRLHKLMANPEEFRQKQRSGSSDEQEERKLLKMLPQAFVYEYDSTQGDEIKLRFKPNPQFRATNRESEAFRNMEGVMFVDAKRKRLAELNGRLVNQVQFGHGLLGHLDKGGTFCVRQKEIGEGHWHMNYLDVQMNGKALFFKTIAVREREVHSDFQRLPDSTTLKDAPRFFNTVGSR